LEDGEDMSRHEHRGEAAKYFCFIRCLNGCQNNHPSV